MTRKISITEIPDVMEDAVVFLVAATTLEWTVPSPPPHGNFAELPTVYRGPYEYSVPGHEEDFWPQHLPPKTTS